MPPVPSRADRPRSGQGLQVHRRPPGTTARYDGRVVVRQSAGILLFRRATVAGTPEIEVLLAHPGGPFFARVAWFSPADARVRLKPTQIPFVDRLVDHLARGAKPDGG